MERDGQHIVPAIEDRFGPVVVMHIPVQHRDLFRFALGQCRLDRDGNIG